MPKNFDIEEREVFEKKYLKIFIKDTSKIGDVRSFLQGLNSVKTVNITSSSSKDSPPINLTIYPPRLYDIKETRAEVEIALNNFFDGGSLDPIFEDEAISAISNKAYFQIIDYIIRLGTDLEKFKELTKNFDEERFRDYFLPFLNSISKHHNTTGETFNKIGKTDILITDQSGKNIFIAECKIWHGANEITNAIDQLLERYVTWRDEKVALIVFNKSVKKFSDVIERAIEAVTNHKHCEKLVGQRTESSASFIFKHPDDERRKINLELILFNCID